VKADLAGCGCAGHRRWAAVWRRSRATSSRGRRRDPGRTWIARCRGRRTVPSSDAVELRSSGSTARVAGGVPLARRPHRRGPPSIACRATDLRDGVGPGFSRWIRTFGLRRAASGRRGAVAR
jgi:hypothetical protein